MLAGERSYLVEEDFEPLLQVGITHYYHLSKEQ